MHISSDFWYVIAAIKKEGNNKRGHQEELKNLKNKGTTDINRILKKFTKDGKIDYIALEEYAKENNKEIIEELTKWEVKPNGKE